MKTRYAITKVNRDGFRVLAFANQGRNHFDTKAAAEKHLRAVIANNSDDKVRMVYGDVSKIRVDPVQCYDHGDAIASYIDTDKAYHAVFTGREVGAIGKFHKIDTVVGGENPKAARLNLYERFEHISGLKLEEV